MPQKSSALLASNPFRDTGNAPVNFEEHLRTIAEDIKRDDAMMANELATLSLRTETQGTNSSKKNTSARRSGRKQQTVEIKDTHSTGTFIAKKREVGLMRLALANKEAEIRHLEEEMDHAEKRLRQQQEQLASTEEKFNNFLKHSNLEQDAAVRRAEVESMAKQERLIDIKKLSAQISHVEQDMRKTEIQLELCMEYKNFMDNLTTPQWFYDVLCDIRVKDISEVILHETEEKYERRAQEITESVAVAAARRESRLQYLALARGRGSIQDVKTGKSSSQEGGVNIDLDEEEEEEIVPLDTQLEQLHQDLTAEAQQRQSEEADRIKKEVESLPVEEVRAILDNDYPQERIPMFFSEPDQILDIFINVEEGNLFLIQNSQELEEELERVAMEYFHEEEEMRTMVRQRHAQMESLATRIRDTQERLTQLEERLADLESSDSVGITGGEETKRPMGITGPRKGKGETVMKQEVLKKHIERAVAEIFRCINQTHSTNPRRPGENDAADDGKHTSIKPRKSGISTSIKPTNPSAKTKKKEGGRNSTTIVGNGGGHQQEGETGANMGPVEMLTIIENKVDEYHRYISNPENAVEETLIMSIMKARDKERRRQARMIHLAKQSTEREERNLRALERSQAPVVRRRGKPIMWRSRPPVESVQGAEQTQGSASPREIDQDEEFFR